MWYSTTQVTTNGSLWKHLQFSDSISLWKSHSACSYPTAVLHLIIYEKHRRGWHADDSPHEQRESSNRRCAKNTGRSPDREWDKDARETYTVSASSGFGELTQWEYEDPIATTTNCPERPYIGNKCVTEENTGLLCTSRKKLIWDRWWGTPLLHLYREKTGNCQSDPWVQAYGE